ncbi:Yip1 family protein [Butyrivibrio sp. LB2008]|uniref:Yip1 family protein n=1 Tax=Butyrivibrio sp. LB2008 TaxID=1408305 RepID=UPI00047EB41E|nr:Yip1 family protein [Butyrivibrio sp. LB2008]
MGVCEYCGKELADGELCKCEQAQNKREANEIRKVFDMIDKGEFGEEERKAKPKKKTTRAKKRSTFAEEAEEAIAEESSEEKLEEKVVKKTRAKAKTKVEKENEVKTEAEKEEKAEVKTEEAAEKTEEEKPAEKVEEKAEEKVEEVKTEAAEKAEEVKAEEAVELKPDPKPVFDMASLTDAKEEKVQKVQEKKAEPVKKIKEEPQKPVKQVKKASAKVPEIDLAAIKEDASEAFARFVDLFSKPVTNGASFAAGRNFTSALIFMVAQVLFSSIFVAVLICKINNEMTEQVFPFMDLSGYKFSAGGSFVLAMLFSALLAVVFALLMYAAGRAMNIDVEFKEAVAIAGIKSAFMIPCIILAIFFTMISAMLGAAIYLIFGIVVLCMVFGIVFEKYKTNKNAMLYLYSAVILLFLIILFVVYSNSVKLYIPDAFLK